MNNSGIACFVESWLWWFILVVSANWDVTETPLVHGFKRRCVCVCHTSCRQLKEYKLPEVEFLWLTLPNPSALSVQSQLSYWQLFTTPPIKASTTIWFYSKHFCVNIVTGLLWCVVSLTRPALASHWDKWNIPLGLPNRSRSWQGAMQRQNGACLRKQNCFLH